MHRVLLLLIPPAFIRALSVVASGTNGDGAAVSGEGDAGSGVLVSSPSIDFGAELLPVDWPGAAADRQSAGGCVIDIGDRFTAEVKVVMPPKASVVVAVTRTFWPTRDCVEVSSR